MKPIVSLIIPVSSNIPSDIINSMIKEWRKQTISIEIILSNQGDRAPDLDCDQLVQFPDHTVFQLSKARNLGAKKSQTEWLAFLDCDIYCHPTLLERMLEIKCDAMHGNTLYSITDIGQIPPESPYKCGAAPMLIKKDLFERIGGYSELYKNWGLDDSDFEWKLRDINVNFYAFDSCSYHVKSTHDAIRSSKWATHRSENNMDLFLSRKHLDVRERIKTDLVFYNS